MDGRGKEPREIHRDHWTKKSREIPPKIFYDSGCSYYKSLHPLRPNPPLTRPVGGANASKPSREERRGRAKVRSGWGKKEESGR